MANNRDDFTQKTIDRMAKRVGYRCSNPNCRKLTCGAAVNPEDYINIGVAAHIRAAAPGGKRYDPKMTASQRKAITNGIWLCQTCSKLIDSDDQRYTVELLHQWKYDAETESAKELENQKIGRFAGVENLDYITALNKEIERLLTLMESIHQRLEAAKQDGNVFMTQAYEKRLDSLMLLFTQLDDQLRGCDLTLASFNMENPCEVRQVQEYPTSKASRGRGIKVAAGLAVGAAVGGLGIVNPGILGGLATLAGSVAIGWGISGLLDKKEQELTSINSRVDIQSVKNYDRAVSRLELMRSAVESLASEVEKLHLERIEQERALLSADGVAVQEK